MAGSFTSLNGFSNRLPRSLSTLEGWGFGLSGLLLWLGTAPSLHHDLGSAALWVWIPCAVVGMMLNLQVKHLGNRWQDISGGTPNYATRLLNKQPLFAKYVALGYYLGWVSVPPMNAIILTDLIQANLELLGVSTPAIALKIGLTALPYIVAFSGTRALGILHLFFMVPAIGLLLTFCLQGLGWVVFSANSASLVQNAVSPTGIGIQEWAKWYFVAVYAAYGCETASSFVADSRNPKATLKSLVVAAWLLPIVYVGGSWVLTRLAVTEDMHNNAFLALAIAAQPFWGQSAPVLVTFLIASGCLLSSATAISNSPRVLYQLALDGYLAPVFGVGSRQGVLGPALVLTAILSLACLAWGDVTRVVMVTGTSYLASMIGIHWGLWVRRHYPESRWAGWSLGFCVIELGVLIVGGVTWSWQDLLMGLLLPIALLLLDAEVRRSHFWLFQPRWWIEKYQRRPSNKFSDLMLTQVSVLIFLICGAMTIGWATRGLLSQLAFAQNANLFVVLLLAVAFVGVAIACWTSLPQVTSVVEAREASEHLFKVAQDAIVVVNGEGVIQRLNPAAQQLFLGQFVDLAEFRGNHLSQLLPELADHPRAWDSWGEQRLTQADQVKILEFSTSDRLSLDQQEYMVILRDVTERKQAETQLRLQKMELEHAFRELQSTQAKLVQSEKMSGLGQLVAGVAHEINNPVSFIAGNLHHADLYTRDLLVLLQLYRNTVTQPDSSVQAFSEAIDLEFLEEDLPKLLSSMQMGVERIQKIVASLRSFSRMDEADMKVVDIHDGMDSTLMILQNRLKATGSKPEIYVIKKYTELPLIECYPGALNQVFMNILSNAIDALEEIAARKQHSEWQPTITITTEFLPSEQLATPAVCIRIADNGAGMPEQIKTRIFDPFYTTKPVGKGTGLGLSISYGIVTEKHGGQLQCISMPDQGTEFTIEIPIHQPSNEAIGSVARNDS
ncbi:MAG: ATP-binding protein [Leptolyngbyaceae cyanobacterium bins.302]|nr:ATP-binding protein [Leptolyngbyaceae cyanobacterium bins.302]